MLECLRPTGDMHMSLLSDCIRVDYYVDVFILNCYTANAAFNLLMTANNLFMEHSMGAIELPMCLPLRNSPQSQS